MLRVLRLRPVQRWPEDWMRDVQGIFSQVRRGYTGKVVYGSVEKLKIFHFGDDCLTRSLVRRKGAVQKGPLSDPPNPGAPRRALPQARPQGIWRAERTAVREHDKGPRTPLGPFGKTQGMLFQQPL